MNLLRRLRCVLRLDHDWRRDGVDVEFCQLCDAERIPLDPPMFHGKLSPVYNDDVLVAWRLRMYADTRISMMVMNPRQIAQVATH